MGTLDMKTGREKTWPEYCWVESFWQHLILTAFWYSSGLKFPWKILSLRARTKITTINIFVVYGDKLKCLTFLAESFEIFNLKNQKLLFTWNFLFDIYMYLPIGARVHTHLHRHPNMYPRVLSLFVCPKRLSGGIKLWCTLPFRFKRDEVQNFSVLFYV